MFPMSKFSNLVARFRHRKPRAHRVDSLVLESCPLHTERPDWAAKAPAQVDAACKRGADVIGFTEVHGHLADILAGVCARNGYGFFHDKASDSAIAYKMTLDHAAASFVPTSSGSNPFVKVEFTFNGSDVTVFALHWPTFKTLHLAARKALTEALIAEMAKASAAKRIAFFLADENPDRPLSDPTAQPMADLAKAGLPLITTELAYYPAGLGVTTVGSNIRDTRVKPLKAVLSDALGSDHHPLTATYGVTRVR